MSDAPYDIAIIGGGIVGLATGLQLSKHAPSLRIAVIEKENEVAQHQTGHNSGVIHSGIYYAPGSLKAKLCAAGVKAMTAFAQQHGISFELCGKLIVATEEHEMPRLKILYERGNANGIQNLEWIEGDRIKTLEPHAVGLAAVYSPKTGIIDYVQVARTMAKLLQENGHAVIKSRKVTAVKKSSDECVLQTSHGEIRSRYAINCGGLYSDQIAKAMGLKPAVRIVPFRGEYCWLRPERHALVKNLIYPVPDPELPFLGVHFTRTLDGKMEAGPNAVLAFAREGYKRSDFKSPEVAEMISNKRFWKMLGRYWKTGIFESFKAVSKHAFARALQRFVPEITADDLIPGPSGVRAQAVDQNGGLVQDFVIQEAPGVIHVLNVPSPAATASLAIGEYIVKLAVKSFGIRTLRHREAAE